MSAELSKHYKAAVIEAKGEALKFKQIPLELPNQGEILIKVLACAICHSDHAAELGLFGNSFPLFPGHERIGDVVAVPDSERRWKIGDRVGGAWHGGHDGSCKACNMGLFQVCDNKAILGVMKDGFYREYATIRTEAVVRVSRDADPAAMAPLICAGVTTFNGLRKQSIVAGSVVAVQGLGGLSHLALHSGAKKDFAEKLGAHEYIDSSKADVGEQLRQLGGANCIILTAPSAKMIPSQINGLGPLGKLLVLAGAPPFEINTSLMIGNGTSNTAWPSGHATDSEDAIDFARLHDVNVMIEKSSLDQANEALDHVTSGMVRFRGVLFP